jgi:hypothetical protein
MGRRYHAAAPRAMLRFADTDLRKKLRFDAPPISSSIFGATSVRDPMFDPFRNDPRFEKIVPSLAPK